MELIIEPGKFYLKTEDGYVVDAVEYNPEREDYQLFESETIPQDILNRYYQLVDGALILDEDKHQKFVEDSAKALAEYEEWLKEK
jgi:hypothetical protein